MSHEDTFKMLIVSTMYFIKNVYEELDDDAKSKLFMETIWSLSEDLEESLVPLFEKVFNEVINNLNFLSSKEKVFNSLPGWGTN